MDEDASQGDENLLEDLMSTGDRELAQGVAKTEGLNGAAVKPVYSQRSMRCYSITDSELHQIGLANIGVTSFASIGVALISFSVDLIKDVSIEGEVSQGVAAAIRVLQPTTAGFGVLFLVFAVIAIWWRRGMIDIIKKESGEAPRTLRQRITKS